MWRRLSGFSVLLMISLGALVSPATRACACSCVPVTAAQAAQQADLVFDGVVLTVDGRAGQASGRPLRVRFAVESVSKGAAVDRVELTTENNSAACGFNFEPGQRYRVHATAGATGLCSGNRELGPAAAQPRPDAGSGPGVAPVGGHPAGGAGPGRDSAAPSTAGPGGAVPASGPAVGGSPVLLGAVVGGSALAGGVLLAGWLGWRRRAQKSA